MERKSNFEAYRIICILLIVIMHTFGTGVGKLNTFLGIFINVIGNIGVTGFILLSGYFGIRLSVKKLVKLDIMMIVWSLASELIMVLSPAIDYNPGMKSLLSCFLPVSSHRYWFLSAYFCLCILSPFINEYLEKIDQKRFKQLIFAAGALFLVLPTIVGFDQTGDGGKGIVNMILAYIIGRYIGIYHKDEKVPAGKVFAMLVGVVTVNFVLNAGVYVLTDSTANYYARDNSIFTMVQAVLLLMLVMQWNVRSRFINMLAVNVVAVYVLEDAIKNVINIVLPNVFTGYKESAVYILIVIAVSLVTFAAGSILEAVRKAVFSRAENFVIDKIGVKVSKWKKQ